MHGKTAKNKQYEHYKEDIAMCMYKVVFEYDDGTIDEIYVSDLSEAYEYESDEDFSYIEVVDNVW